MERITFDEFEAILRSELIPPGELGEFVDFDEHSTIPRLAFRADAIRGEIPAGYDVDEAIYRYERRARLRRAELRDLRASSERIEVVAEGDSWMNLPPIIKPRAIADHLENDSRFRTNNIGRWGHTLKTMLEEREYLDEIRDETQFFILSAGGNDLQEGLERGDAVFEYDPDRAPDEYLTQDGVDLIREIGNGFRTLLNQVSARFGNLRTFTYGYDYPRPLLGRGKYIGKHLREKGIPDSLMQAVIDPVIDLLNEEIASATATVPSATYLNCREVTVDFSWYDDMHPRSDGFAALAEVFAGAMTQPA